MPYGDYPTDDIESWRRIPGPNEPRMEAEPSWLEKQARSFMAEPNNAFGPPEMGVVSTPVKAARRSLLSKILGIHDPTPTWGGRLDPAIGPTGEAVFPSIGSSGKLTWPSMRPAVAEAVEANSPLSPMQKVQNNLVNSRNNSYHATDIEGLQGIFGMGKIKPGGPLGYWGSYPEEIKGVSVSRVPRVKSKADKAFTLVLDNEKLPTTRPLAEKGYEKQKDLGLTHILDKYGTPEDYDEYNALADLPSDQYTQAYEAYSRKLRRKYPSQWPMNPVFEFENRTYNEPIPVDAVKKVIVDEQALPRYGGVYHPASGPPLTKEELLRKAQEYVNLDIPVQILPSGREVHRYPASQVRGMAETLFGPERVNALREERVNALRERLKAILPQSQPESALSEWHTNLMPGGESNTLPMEPADKFVKPQKPINPGPYPPKKSPHITPKPEGWDDWDIAE